MAAIQGANQGEFKMPKRLISGKEVYTVCVDIDSLNDLTVEVGTTGLKNGDSGHGGRTYFEIKNVAGTDIKIGFSDDRERVSECGFYVELGGDSELQTMVAALSQVIKVLACQSKKVNIGDVKELIISDSGIDISFIAESRFEWFSGISFKEAKQ